MAESSKLWHAEVDGLCGWWDAIFEVPSGPHSDRPFCTLCHLAGSILAFARAGSEPLTGEAPVMSTGPDAPPTVWAQSRQALATDNEASMVVLELFQRMCVL